MAALNNETLWNMVKNAYPKFKQDTADVTYKQFMSRGYEAVKFSETRLLNDFFELSMRVVLNQVNISDAKDPFDTFDVGENFATPFGGVIQRISVGTVKPRNPMYLGLKNGDSPDPFVVSKPDVMERFFLQNFDFQAQTTIQDEELRRQIFTSEFGMSEFAAGLMKGLQNSYVIQKYENKLECLNKAVNSTTYGLKDSQKVEVELAKVPTADQLKELYYKMYVTITAMISAPQTSAYNAYGFASVQDVSRLRVLIRQGLPAQMRFNVLASAFNKEDLGLQDGVQVMEVPHFGGLEAYQEAEFTTPLYPVYNKMGQQIGFNTEADQSEVTVENSAVYWKDPNANLVALIMDKGAIFTNMPHGVSVEPQRNAGAKYNNYFLTAPQGTIAVDAAYNMVGIYNNFQE